MIFCMADATPESVMEILREVQAEMVGLRDDMRDVKAGQCDILSVLASMQNADRNSA